MSYMTHGCAGTANQFAAEDAIDDGITADEKIIEKMPELQLRELAGAKPEIWEFLSDEWDELVRRTKKGEFAHSGNWPQPIVQAMSECIADVMHDNVLHYESLAREIMK